MEGIPFSPPQSGDIANRVSGNSHDSALSKISPVNSAKEISPSTHIKDVKTLKDSCLVLCGELCQILSMNKFMLTESSKICSSDIFSSKCTVGIMLHGTKIENTLIGGPSYGILEKGDFIVSIDGENVTDENVYEKLKGCDVPGTEVLIIVERSGNTSLTSVRSVNDCDHLDSRKIEVSVSRMATAEIADRRRMFDLFTIMEVRFQAKTSSTLKQSFANSPLNTSRSQLNMTDLATVPRLVICSHPRAVAGPHP
jgi:hypothetical protein